MGRQDRFVFTGVGLRGKQHRAVAYGGAQGRELVTVRVQWRRIRFETARNHDTRRPKLDKTVRCRIVLRQADVE
jgi:hypothetical protein